MKKYLAEFIGTLALVTMGCGTAMLVGCDAASGCGYLLTALAFGLSIVAMAYCIGNISGCHVNPAVSLGVFLSGGMSIVDFIGYVIAYWLPSSTWEMLPTRQADMAPMVWLVSMTASLQVFWLKSF